MARGLLQPTALLGACVVQRTRFLKELWHQLTYEAGRQFGAICNNAEEGNLVCRLEQLLKEKLYTQRLKKGNLLIIRLMKFTERKTEEGKMIIHFMKFIEMNIEEEEVIIRLKKY